MYDHKSIEAKWQRVWEEAGAFATSDTSRKPKFYCLIEFPYPSGAGLHMGHPRSYTALDVVARKRRMEGFNVLYPIGWDAFGLPTENYAIKTGRKPQEVTAENIATFKRQLKALGISFDWSREVNTTDPSYYKWTQWMFLEFFKAGLAYKARADINWCPSCKIGLANEEVVNDACERCGGPVEKREKEQWMLAITKYADRLLEDLETVDYLPKIKKQQQDWIGKSEGAEITFVIASKAKQSMPVEIASSPMAPRNDVITVFTTRPDTIFGVTFLVVSPEMAQQWINVGWQAPAAVVSYVNEATKKTEMDRQNDEREKTGVDTGIKAINPATGKEIPVWVADYVLGHYGTGAIMAVPAHDARDLEFAEAFGLPLGDGALVSVDEVLKKTGGRPKITYKLRDWVFSRQRYWGEPIPLVWCDACAKKKNVGDDPRVVPQTSGWVPLPVDQLPLTLPEVEKYQPTDTGESPLAAIKDWVQTTCPECGGPARRETDTMPNWAGSSWYFLRYIDPKNDRAFADPKKLKKWMPVDWYNGGMEHTVLHLLYSRFWNKVMFDRGHVPVSEPYAKRTSHGLVLATDGAKMSKSKGNVVNPDEIVERHGADALRLFELFMGPFAEPAPYNDAGVVGVRRFLEKVMLLSEKVTKRESETVARALHKTIKKVGEDVEAMRFNTAVSQLMIFVNTVIGAGGLTAKSLKTFLMVLSPFAPHVAEEAYAAVGKGLVMQQEWPEFDPAMATDATVTIGVQVNGKVRGDVVLASDASEAEAREAAVAHPSVAKYVGGQSIKKFVYVPGRIINIVAGIPPLTKGR